MRSKSLSPASYLSCSSISPIFGSSLLPELIIHFLVSGIRLEPGTLALPKFYGCDLFPHIRHFFVPAQRAKGLVHLEQHRSIVALAADHAEMTKPQAEGFAGIVLQFGGESVTIPDKSVVTPLRLAKRNGVEDHDLSVYLSGMEQYGEVLLCPEDGGGKCSRCDGSGSCTESLLRQHTTCPHNPKRVRTTRKKKT